MGVRDRLAVGRAKSMRGQPNNESEPDTPLALIDTAGFHATTEA